MADWPDQDPYGLTGVAMDLYVFASHPTPEIREKAGRLVAHGEEGNRIRTRVDFAFGPSHAMYAINCPDLAAAAEHHSALAASGTTTQYSLLSCISPDCTGLLPTLPLSIYPSYLLGFEFLAFALVWLEGAITEWPRFNSPGIASAIAPGRRKLLIEFGSSDLNQVHEDLGLLGNVSAVRGLETFHALGSGSAD